MRLILLKWMEMQAQQESEADIRKKKADRLLNDQVLVDWLSSYAHSLCRGSGLQDADADDLVQESFQKAVDAINTFREDKKLEPWLKSILINAWRDHLRRKKRESARFLNDQGESAKQLPDQTDIQHMVDVRLVYLDLHHRIEMALRALKARHRMALLLLIVEGLTYLEISKRMGTNVNQVKGHVFQARRKLAELKLAY